MLSPKEIKQYEELGIDPPATQAHGTDAEIASLTQHIKPKQWRLEGNKLIGQTDWGELAQFIPTNYILEGTDLEGMPIFKKIA